MKAKLKLSEEFYFAPQKRIKGPIYKYEVVKVHARLAYLVHFDGTCSDVQYVVAGEDGLFELDGFHKEYVGAFEELIKYCEAELESSKRFLKKLKRDN